MASLYAEIGADTKGFEAGAAKVKSGLGALAPKLEQAGASVTSFMGNNAALIGTLGAVGGAAFAVGKAIWSSAKAWEESSKVNAKLNQVLKSTGNQVGYTSKQLDTMANSMAQVNGLDDEVVKNGEALMLTFTQVGHQAFPAATQAAIDMSAVLGTDLQGSIIQVGKAMNDFTGFTSLKRAGVSFTAEQMKQIANFKETNNLAGYQNLILGELQTEFGGAAQEMNKAGLQTEAVSLAFGNLKEAVGGANAGWIQDFNRGVAYTTQGLADWVQGNVDARAAEQAHVDSLHKYAASIGTTYQALYIAHAATAAYASIASEAKTAREDSAVAETKFSDAIQATEEEQQAQLDTGLKLTEMTSKFSEKTDALKTALSSEQSEIDKLIKQGYNPLGEKVKSHMDKVNELKDNITANNEAQAKSQQEYALSLLKTSNASAELQKKFALASGLVTQSALNQETAQQQLTDAYMSGSISAATFANNIQTLMAKIQKMDGKHAKSYVDVWIYEHTIQLNGPGGGFFAGRDTATTKNDAKGNNQISGRWTGGQLSNGWTLVGDMPGGRPTAYSELISPTGYVYDAKTTKKLLESGFVSSPDSMAVGGDAFSSSGKGVSVGQSRGAQAAKSFSRSKSQRGGNVGMAVNVSADAAQPVDTNGGQSATQQMQMQQEAIAATAANTDVLNQMLNVLESKLARDIGTQVGNKLAKFS